MSCRSENREASGAAGFTLVEALAALAIMAAGLAAIAELAGGNLYAGYRTERHIAQIAVAREIVTGMPSRDALPFGVLTGSLHDHQWRIDAKPVSVAFPTGQSAGRSAGQSAGQSASWTPQGIVLLVKSPTGAMIEIDTIRLRKDTAK